MKKKIAIIGAGIAGLTIANLIKQDSEFEIILYEKKETFNFITTSRESSQKKYFKNIKKTIKNI